MGEKLGRTTSLEETSFVATTVQLEIVIAY
jgi:hypothetical protein